MAGHSKFSNIKHRKGAQDKKRAKIFNKIAREITVAAKAGMPDPAMNPRLRLAITNARAANMPKDRVDRAIKVASEVAGGDDYEEIRYEGYGPGGVAVIIEALTDNRNRTAGEVRTAFTRNGGNMGETGSVAFMFERLGQITYPVATATEDEMFEAAVEAGAQNVETDEDFHVIYTALEDFSNVQQALVEKFDEPENGGLIWKPNTPATPDDDQARTLFKLIETLEDDDDVQDVFFNYEFDDALIEELAE